MIIHYLHKLKNFHSPLLIVSIISIVLSILKLSAFIYTGALIILGSFFDSLADSLLSLINHIIYKASRKQPDKEHPFGHGGLEVISSIIQGTMILAFAIVLIIETIQRILTKNLQLNNTTIGIVILFISAIVSLTIQIYLKACLKKLQNKGQRSLSILSDSVHYNGDFWHNFLSAIALTLISYSKILILDNIVALIIAFILIKNGYKLLRTSIKDILHEQGDPKISEQIKTIVNNVTPNHKGIHMLRLRHLGPTLFIDFHLTLPSYISIKEANKIVLKIKNEINRQIDYSDVMIQVDPDTLSEETL